MNEKREDSPPGARVSKRPEDWTAEEKLKGGGEDERQGPRTDPGNKLSGAERQEVLAVATSPEFRDESPKQMVPTLADQCILLASEATFYRILREAKLLAHREPSRPPSPKPRELVATGPNQVYTWDITYLRSPVRGEFFYLSMFVDLFSRKIVGWRVDEEESVDHAAELIRRICWTEGIEPGTLVLHADNGGPMKGSTMLATLEKLGVVPSFSRPRVSDDNPYSEALFRTLKYRPDYPHGPFEDIEAARAWVEAFVEWYNHRPCTAPSSSSRLQTGMREGTRRSWRNGRRPTRPLGRRGPNAGPDPLGTGQRSPKESSIPGHQPRAQNRPAA